jgi:hypothetical protein
MNTQALNRSKGANALMKLTSLSLFSLLVALGIERPDAVAEEVLWKTPLVTSTEAAEAARMAVELEAEGGAVSLLDGTGVITEGMVTIDASGTVSLTVHGVSTGSKGFLLLNQGDVNGVGGERDFVFSAPFPITAGKIDATFPDALPPGVIEDLLVTLLLDDGSGTLTTQDRILAVPGVLANGVQDSDGDGVPNPDDACPESELRPTVVINGCDSGVDNLLAEDGCTITDQIEACADRSKNHGHFVRCVSRLTNTLIRAGEITGEEKGAIQSCAAQANIP